MTIGNYSNWCEKRFLIARERYNLNTHVHDSHTLNSSLLHFYALFTRQHNAWCSVSADQIKTDEQHSLPSLTCRIYQMILKLYISQKQVPPRLASCGQFTRGDRPRDFRLLTLQQVHWSPALFNIQRTSSFRSCSVSTSRCPDLTRICSEVGSSFVPSIYSKTHEAYLPSDFSTLVLMNHLVNTVSIFKPVSVLEMWLVGTWVKQGRCSSSSYPREVRPTLK